MKGLFVRSLRDVFSLVTNLINAFFDSPNVRSVGDYIIRQNIVGLGR